MAIVNHCFTNKNIHLANMCHLAKKISPCFRYSLEGEEAAAFTIDELTGQLSARSSLDREQQEVNAIFSVTSITIYEL